VFHDPVTNSGGTIEVFPGSTPIFLQGLTTSGTAAALSVHLADPANEADSGQIEIAGSAQLDGNLQLALAEGFDPAAGDSFPILTAAGGITGSLALSTVPALPGGMQWDLDIEPKALVLRVVATGDYNGNGIVDAADYVVWRNTVGEAGPGLAADGDGSGTVDAGDYEIWRSRFGGVAQSASGELAAAFGNAVPEPGSVILLCLGAAGSLSRRRKLH
jgi:hypothetical protein